MYLSIITINYNNADGLKKTVESFQQQASHDFEHIIIDGGSTDGSVEVDPVIHRHPPRVLHPQADNQSSSITYWISEQDKGIYQGMNKGI